MVHFRPASIAILLVFLLASPTQAEHNSASKNPDQFICNTSPARTAVERALYRYHRQRRALALSSEVGAVTSDRGNIAVLEDDGTVIVQPNQLDLTNSSITFTPGGGDLYTVAAQSGLFEDGSGSATVMSLGDDDSVQVPLPFTFVFYGISYNSVFLNSDGNLTFTASDTAISERNLSRVVSGP